MNFNSFEKIAWKEMWKFSKYILCMKLQVASWQNLSFSEDKVSRFYCILHLRLLKMKTFNISLLKPKLCTPLKKYILYSADFVCIVTCLVEEKCIKNCFCSNFCLEIIKFSEKNTKFSPPTSHSLFFSFS